NNHVFCVKPIGRDKTVRILYRALNLGYYTSNMNMSNLRDRTIAAARDEFGYWSPEVAEVEAAFFAIGVGYNGNSGANTDPAFGSAYLPFVWIANRTESGQKVYNFNNAVLHSNYIVPNGAAVEVTSNTGIHIAPVSWDATKSITIENGSTYWGHIATACSQNGTSGARVAANNTMFSPDNSATADDNNIKNADFEFTIV